MKDPGRARHSRERRQCLIPASVVNDLDIDDETDILFVDHLDQVDPHSFLNSDSDLAEIIEEMEKELEELIYSQEE